MNLEWKFETLTCSFERPDVFVTRGTGSAPASAQSVRCALEVVKDLQSHFGLFFWMIDLGSVPGIPPETGRAILESAHDFNHKGFVMFGGTLTVRLVATAINNGVMVLGKMRCPYTAVKDEAAARQWVSAERQKMAFKAKAESRF